MSRVKQGTVVKIEDAQVMVHGYLEALHCYTVSYDGASHICAAHIIEQAEVVPEDAAKGTP